MSAILLFSIVGIFSVAGVFFVIITLKRALEDYRNPSPLFHNGDKRLDEVLKIIDNYSPRKITDCFGFRPKRGAHDALKQCQN